MPEVAAWSPDDRFIVSMAPLSSNTVLVRDATTGNIINRLTLPPLGADAALVVQAVVIDVSGHRAIASGHVTTPNACRSLNYYIDLAAMRIIPAYGTLDPHSCNDPPPSADALAGILARAHHGGLQLRDQMTSTYLAETGLFVTDASGGKLATLSRPRQLKLASAALASDGRRLVFVIDCSDSAEKLPPATVVVFDIATAQYLPGGMTAHGKYDRVQWIDGGHYLLTRAFNGSNRDVAPTMSDDDSLQHPPPGLIIDAANGAVSALTLPPRCYVAPLGPGEFIGAGLANCATADAPGRSLQHYTAAAGWQPFAMAATKDAYVDAIAVATDRSRLAVVTRATRDGGTFAVVVIDAASGDVVARRALGRDLLNAGAKWRQNGEAIILSVADQPMLWTPGSSVAPVPIHGGHELPTDLVADVIAAQGSALIGGNGLIRIDATDASSRSRLDFAPLIAGGMVPGKPVFWGAFASGSVGYWDTRNWSEMLTDYQFAHNQYLNVTADGRYDTNLGPDGRAFRWLVTDDPLRSLGPQTFMRNYYEPRLAQRLMQCIAETGGCARTFPPRPPPTDLDRVLPLVTIDAVRPGPAPDSAEVDVSAREGVDPVAPNGQTRSGLYNLRLFRDGALVAEYPAPPPDRFDQSVDDWRSANAAPVSADGAAHAHFTVALPTTNSGPVTFSAYGFNRDRVKSDTVTARFEPPLALARARRAYVLAIGVDGYAEPRLKLRFSTNDAALIAKRLAIMPGLEVHPVAMIGEGRPITKAMIVAALDLLAGGNRAADLAILRAGGIDANGFAAATPDDVVIVSFSGHGWADAQNNFYLLPADAQWPDTAEFPVTASLLSSAEIATLLKRVDAGEMALVIDACHSAASVDTVGFKPGPMGDPGLGQLAWDKGVRVLAAAASGDVAWEDATRRQGLLTYTLAREGIDDSGFGQADLNRDGRIMLDEWLRYAVARLPSLSQEALAQPHAARGRDIGAFTVIKDSLAVPPSPQEPSLFDYTTRPSAVVLRTTHP